MEIEIVTLKKKLTKTMIEQIREIELQELANAKVIGFVNINPRVILLEIGTLEYRKAYWNWNWSGINNIYRKVGKYTAEKHFRTKEDRDMFLAKLDEYKKEAVQIYV